MLRAGFAFLIGLFHVTSSYAARTVQIPVDGTLKLTNPTAAIVTYSLTCKDKTGAVVTTESNQTLAAGVTRVVGTSSDASACSTTQNLTATTTYLSGGAARCYSNVMGTVQHPNAATWCGTGFHVCSITEIAAVRTGNYLYGFVTVPSTWSYTTDGGSTWTNTTSSAHIASLDSMGSSSYRCATGSNGSGTVINACFNMTYNDPMVSQPWYFSSVICCPDLTGLAHCSVTIESATPVSAHLISPQFKGGTAF